MDFDSIVSKNKYSITKDPQLISGFFSAIIAFAENVVSRHKNPINQIQMKNGNYIFFNIGSFYIILETTIADNSLSKEDYDLIITEIGDVFYASFCKDEDSENLFFSIEDEIFENKVRAIISTQIRQRIAQKFFQK
jgi:hypothetical protein